jgi:hypothetical protein
MKTPFTGLSNKRIPTIIGLLILVVALVLGTVFFQQGLGVFTPRATPETTPKQVRITNVVDSGFTISYLTEGPVAGFIKYGTEENALRQTATDDRDTLTGSIGEYTLHHITVRGLQPNTSYYYVLGTGSGTLFDNNGAPFKIITARKSGSPTAARTVYGSVTTESGVPAEGAIVYVAVDGAGEMSSLVKNSGSWAIPLSNARTSDGAGYASISDETALQLFVQGPATAQTAKGTVTAGQYKSTPIPTISYGQTTISDVASIEEVEETPPSEVATASGSLENESQLATATESATSASTSSSLAGDSIATGSSTLMVLNLDEASKSDQPVTLGTSQPTITGTAAPNVTVTIEVHSDTQISKTLTANADGTFSLNIAELSKNLEPGEHTVTYSYVDPTTGKTVPETVIFFVEPQSTSANLLAQANTSSTPRPTATPSATPFGSSNPFPIGGATSSATATGSGSASGSGRTSQPSTSSGLPVSGSVGTTMALIFGGIFFIISGLWSFWVSRQYSTEELND